MTPSKRNADLLRDTLLELTGNPWAVTKGIEELSNSNKDFDKVQFTVKGKAVKTITFEGNPKGTYNLKL